MAKNKQKITTGILVGMVLLAGLALLLTYLPKKPKPQPAKNISAIHSDKNTPLTTIDKLNYFDKAEGYFVMPKTDGKIPGVVLIHENRGLRPEIKQAADELAKEGYMVLAVDLLGKVVETQEEAQKLTANYNEQQGIANMRSAVKFLREQGATKIASLGWCFGGKQSISLATSGEKLDATITYYGSFMPTDKARLKPIKWPVLGIFGDEDKLIPLTKVEEFRSSLKSLGLKNEVYVYPGVGHAFANPSGPNYAPEATKDAWQRTVVFLNKYMK